MNGMFCGAQISAGDWTESYLKGRICHSGNGNTFHSSLHSFQRKSNLLFDKIEPYDEINSD